jgi:long-chain acyl-CoA synthetase
VAALYFGAMLAGVVLVPLDLQMTPEVVARIAERADTRHLVVGTGKDAPDPAQLGIPDLRTRTVPAMTAPPDDPPEKDEHPFPADWEEQVAAWTRPDRETLFEIVFTSGTTGQPKGVMITHGNLLATVEASDHIIPAWQHRAVSLIPLSHLFGQLELFYALFIGGDVLYLRSRNPRVIFAAIRAHRMTTMVAVPQLLQLFWTAIEREVERQGKERAFARLRQLARRLPYPARRLLFRRVHQNFGGSLRLLISAAAFLPPALQEAWEDLGVVVMQGYGATECGFASATSFSEHLPGTVGKPYPPVSLRLAPEDQEILVGGPTVSPGYWRDADATGAAFVDGWYHTGDIGRLDPRGNLILSGRKKNIIVLPNGLNVFPEDIENALRVAGLDDVVVLETEPGRIEAVVLPPGTPVLPRGDAAAGSTASREATRTPAEEAALRTRLEAAVKAANLTLAAHQRVVGWRLWEEGDFPRTHTLKIRRDLVRAAVVRDAPLPVREEAGAR